jgi:hypothetical protein
MKEKPSRRGFLQTMGAGALTALLQSRGGADEPVNEEPVASKTLSEKEHAALDHCLALIRKRQLGADYGSGEGAITMRWARNLKDPEEIQALISLLEQDIAIEKGEIDGRPSTDLRCALRDKLKSGELKPADVTVGWTIDDAERLLASTAQDGSAIAFDATKDLPAFNGIRVVPYFANFAALAMVEGYEYTHRVEDLECAARWLAFYARKQHPEAGHIADYGGTSGPKKSFQVGETIDSVDSYSSTLLDLAKRYHEVVSQAELTPEQHQKLNSILPQDTLEKAAELAFSAIKASATDAYSGLTIARPEVVLQESGLTIPSYDMQYLMDNVEVYSGLCNGAAFFRRVGKNALAIECERMADKMAHQTCDANGIEIANLSVFRQPEGGYAFARAPDGTMHPNDNSEAYPHGLANLFGLLYLPDADKEKNKSLLEEILKSHDPRTHPRVSEHIHLERILLAAERIGVAPDELRQIRSDLVDYMQAMGDHTQVHRAGVSALALTKGAQLVHSVEPAKSLER